jgi:hypothetical protein
VLVRKSTGLLSGHSLRDLFSLANGEMLRTTSTYDCGATAISDQKLASDSPGLSILLSSESERKTAMETSNLLNGAA